jgi:iron complex transport system ATP-binding protein
MAIPSTKGIIKVQDLFTGYVISGSEKQISKNLNLELKQSEVVAIMGPNGSGKSTLIRTLCNLQAPLGGSILVNDTPVNKLTNEELSKLISVVLTDPIANSEITVFDLIATGRHPYTNWLGRLTNEDKSIIEASLKDVGLADFAERRLGSLSDGEKQRVMIARALAQQSPIIILDEPTAHLDIIHRFEIMYLLRKLAKEQNKAILLSIHELDLALQSADYLWLLKNDSIVVGRPEDMVLNGLLHEVFDNKRLHFDQETGGFKMTYQSSKRVQLVSDNPIYSTWTNRVLNKNGFETTIDDNSVKVEISNNSWRVGEHTFHSLDTLLTYLSAL